jgi:hypothetical protein
MKLTIDGRTYDTETATLVMEVQQDVGERPVAGWQFAANHELWRTPEGRYFSTHTCADADFFSFSLQEENFVPDAMDTITDGYHMVALNWFRERVRAEEAGVPYRPDDDDDE